MLQSLPPRWSGQRKASAGHGNSGSLRVCPAPFKPAKGWESVGSEGMRRTADIGSGKGNASSSPISVTASRRRQGDDNDERDCTATPEGNASSWPFGTTASERWQEDDIDERDWSATPGSMSVDSDDCAAPQVWDPERRAAILHLAKRRGDLFGSPAAKAVAAADETTTFAKLRWRSMESGGAHAVATRAGPDSPWEHKTYTEYHNLVMAFARSVAAIGAPAHTGLCLLGPSRLEWLVAYLGAQSAGMYAVTLPRNIVPSALKDMVDQVQPSILLVGSVLDLLRCSPFLSRLKDTIKCIVLYFEEQLPPGLLDMIPVKVFSWESFLYFSDGPNMRKYREARDMEVEFRANTTMPSNVASVVFTQTEQHELGCQNSGVMLTHDNLTWTAVALLAHLKQATPGFAEEASQANQRILSLSSLHRALPQVVSIHLPILMGCCLYLDEKPVECDLNGDQLVSTIKGVSPLLVFGSAPVYRHVSESIRDTVFGKGATTICRFVRGNAIRVLSSGTVGGVSVTAVQAERPAHTANGNSTVASKVARKIMNISTRKFGFNPGGAWLCDGDLGKCTMGFFSALNLFPICLLGVEECTGVMSMRFPVNRGGMREANAFLNGSLPVQYGGDDPSSSNAESDLMVCGRNVLAGYIFDKERTEEAVSNEHVLSAGVACTSRLMDWNGPASSIYRLSSGGVFAPHRFEVLLQSGFPEMAHVVVFLAVDASELVAVMALDTVKSRDPIPSPTRELGQLATKRSWELRSGATTVDEVEMCPRWADHMNDVVQTINSEGIPVLRDIDGNDGAPLNIATWHILRDGLSILRRELTIDGLVNRAEVHRAVEEQLGYEVPVLVW
mmetsp:Transcript_24512/g.76869  ORF Transcript_24512/g.76869 Transcript_24512/m.76869 type:complete len:844 (-) Transcript_24512:147-2678(-)